MYSVVVNMQMLILYSVFIIGFLLTGVIYISWTYIWRTSNSAVCPSLDISRHFKCCEGLGHQAARSIYWFNFLLFNSLI